MAVWLNRRVSLRSNTASDDVFVGVLAGHTDPELTSAYDRRGFRARVAAVAWLEVPL